MLFLDATDEAMQVRARVTARVRVRVRARLRLRLRLGLGLVRLRIRALLFLDVIDAAMQAPGPLGTRGQVVGVAGKGEHQRSGKGEGADVVCEHAVNLTRHGSRHAQERCAERGKASGRTDDTAEVIARRARTFQNQSMPVVDELGRRGLLQKIDASGDADAVLALACQAFEPFAKS